MKFDKKSTILKRLRHTEVFESFKGRQDSLHRHFLIVTMVLEVVLYLALQIDILLYPMAMHILPEEKIKVVIIPEMP